MKLILASSSPRRKQLLSVLGLPFETINPNIDESALENESPEKMVLRLAALKAQTVFRLVGPGHRVLGGDTTVAIDGEILGKPADRNDAVCMLKKLSGRTHSVYSGVAVADHENCSSLLSETKVTFSELSDAAIAAYCDTPDPYDKAGAYGIQGHACNFVSDLDGSCSGVVGLPLRHARRLLLGNGPERVGM